MSAGDDSLFARWSRRKHAMRQSDAARPDEAAHAADSSVAKAESADAGREAPAVDPAAVELPEPLPSLENLTAESDLTAFLREGVPESLRKAALRKMWSLDPTIRDHVGLAECTWNFNLPGSIPGFGPIDATSFAPLFPSRPTIAEAADPEVPAPTAQVPETAATPAKTAEQDDATDAPPQESADPDVARAGASREIEAAPTTADHHGGTRPRE